MRDSKLVYSTKTGDDTASERKVSEVEAVSEAVEAAVPRIVRPQIKRAGLRAVGPSEPVQIRRPADRDIHPLVLAYLKKRSPDPRLIEWRTRDADGLWDCVSIHNQPGPWGQDHFAMEGQVS